LLKMPVLFRSNGPQVRVLCTWPDELILSTFGACETL